MNSSLIQSALLAVAEKSINSALQFDPGTVNRLHRLEGKVFQISCTLPDVSVLLLPCEGGVMLQSVWTEEDTPDPDCSIKGDSAALLRLMTAENKAEALFSPNIELQGDTESAQKLQAIMADLDIDWEEKLSQWVGDIAAHQLGNQARSLFQWGRQTVDSLLLNVEEYLHEEARAMPPRLELEAFYQDIAKIALATDRLAARLQRLNESNAKPGQKQTKEDSRP